MSSRNHENAASHHMPTLGMTIKERRKALGLSQEELARRCCLNRTYITDIEANKRNPSLKVMLLIADSLQISLSDLMRHAEEMANFSPSDN